MKPSYASTIRTEAVKKCCFPELTVRLTLDCDLDKENKQRDLVEFLCGLLLGSNIKVRKWFAQFIKNGQKEGSASHSVLKQLREELMKDLVSLTPSKHRQRIRRQWHKDRGSVTEGKRRITVDEQDKETLEIIEGIC